MEKKHTSLNLYQLITNPIQYNHDARLLRTSKLVDVREGIVPLELNCQGLVQIAEYLATTQMIGPGQILSKESFLNEGEFFIRPGFTTDEFKKQLIEIPNTTSCILYSQTRNGTIENKLVQDWNKQENEWNENALLNLHMGMIINSSDEAHECMFSPEEWAKLKLDENMIYVFHTTNNPRVEVGRNSRSGLTTIDEFCNAYFPVALKLA